MLAVSPFRDENHQQTTTTLSSMASNYTVDTQEFPDFSDANLLIDGIDFDDLFTGIDRGDVLPDLEMDPEILAEFSASSGGGDDRESSEMTTMINPSSESVEENYDNNPKEEDDKVSGSGIGSSLSKEAEIVSKREEPAAVEDHGDKQVGRTKSSSRSKKNNQGQRKVKVDWTPELHRRFVQAVEQLGVDKAVPSRILELMGIDCLTRHNIASHLQKYRSHRKHLLAREAEATSWNQRRQMYGARRDMNHWNIAPPPTVGFHPMAHHHHHCRPLHVWGHPTVDQSLFHMWHRPSPSPPPPQPHSQPVPVLARWHQQQIPNGLTPPGTPCFAQSCIVPGIPPHHQATYKVEPPPGTGVPTAQSGPHPLVDFHPSKESIDAALRDVLSKPCQPLPLGLKPPSVDGVIAELQRQGVRKIPPSSANHEVDEDRNRNIEEEDACLDRDAPKKNPTTYPAGRS